MNPAEMKTTRLNTLSPGILQTLLLQTAGVTPEYTQSIKMVLLK